MNIGIDIDDTIVDTYETLLKLISMKYSLDYNNLINKKLNYSDIWKQLKDFDKVNKDLFSIMVRSVKIKENVIDVFNKLKKDGHNIVLISARNYKDYTTPYETTYDFLIKNKIPFDKLIVDVKNKGEKCLAEKIDIFIDDNTKNCKDVSSVGINTLQFNALFNEAKDEFRKVYSWNEVYDIISCLSN